jgi:peptidoglycan-associated lipoprotein
MSAPKKTTPFLAAALLIAGGLACSKPEAAPQPVKPAVDTTAKPKVDDEAVKRKEAETKRKAEDAEEAARKAAAAKAVEYQRTAQAALKDIHFDYDKSDIKEGDKPVLVAIADFMKAHPQANIMVEGNCDERGTIEYNLALGERRAHAGMAYLVGLGVPSAHLTTISYGKEKPLCKDATETCWAENRRDHFVLK